MDESIRELSPIGNGVEIYVSRHHTFGTDAVILNHFAAVKPRDSVVDLGTGCGIIPFLMLRGGGPKSVVGVDISKEAIDLAVATKEKNKFDNFTPILSDLNELRGKVEFGCHTLVTCNPPYKAPNAGLKNPDGVLSVARHEVACTLEDIVSVSARLLQTGGRLCMCQRPERLSELMCLMGKYKVEPKRLRLVCKYKGHEPWLVLVEGKRSAKTGLRIEPNLYVEDKQGNFSSEMIEIYGAYKEGYL